MNGASCRMYRRRADILSAYVTLNEFGELMLLSIYMFNHKIGLVPSLLIENFNIFDFELSQEDMTTFDSGPVVARPRRPDFALHAI